jgi:hypothetical protein
VKAALTVPVVWHNGSPSSEAQVLFCEVVSEPVRPERAYRSDVEDVGKLCMAVQAGLDANRGEWPDEAYVLATHAASARTKPLQGRSCALAMALASLSGCYHLPIHAPAVATGDLDGSGNVLPVSDLLVKLKACARGPHAGDLVLFPACQLPDGAADQRLAAAEYAEIVAILPGLSPVATLAQAANLALRPPEAFNESRAAQIRNEIEQLRYDRSRAGELFDRSRELFELAHGLPNERGLSPILRYHALMTGEFALRTLVHDNAGLRNWPEVPADNNADLRARLVELAEALVANHQAWLPAELRAEHANFHAVRGFETLDYLGAIQLADQALSLPKLVQGQHSERRKLLGTRGQFRCRQGLRALAVGLHRDAAYWLTGAVDDARKALEDAPKGPGSAETNDAARVRVYVCHALLALRCLRDWTAAEQAEFDHQAQVVLGCLLAEDPHSPPPSQAPGWMVDAVLRRLKLEGKLPETLALWDRVAAIDYALQPGDSKGPQRMAAILQPGQAVLPCDVSLLQTLLEVAVALGLADRAREFAQPLAILHAEPTLTALVRLWPATLAPQEWALALPDWLRRWRAGDTVDLRLPAGLEREQFLTDHLQALRNPNDSLRSQRLLQLWLGVPA